MGIWEYGVWSMKYGSMEYLRSMVVWSMGVWSMEYGSMEYGVCSMEYQSMGV